MLKVPEKRWRYPTEEIDYLDNTQKLKSKNVPNISKSESRYLISNGHLAEPDVRVIDFDSLQLPLRAQIVTTNRCYY